MSREWLAKSNREMSLECTVSKSLSLEEIVSLNFRNRIRSLDRVSLDLQPFRPLCEGSWSRWMRKRSTGLMTHAREASVALLRLRDEANRRG